ncbi:unnamed protein product, partial [Ascophyllum nodosum]
ELRRAVPALDQLLCWSRFRVGDALHKFDGAILQRLGHLFAALAPDEGVHDVQRALGSLRKRAVFPPICS